MNVKLKVLGAAIALSFLAITSANAATSPGQITQAVNAAAVTGSSLVFSAWDDNTSIGYSIDLGATLNSIIGADPYVSGLAGSDSNAMVASGYTYTGGNLISFALPDWNLSAGAWNLAATDTVGRNRVLVTNADSAYTGTYNSQISGAADSLTNYLALGAALSTTAGTTSTPSDAWYAGSASWNDDLGGKTGFVGSSVGLADTASLFVLWQKSLSLDSSAGGISALQNANGNLFTAYLTNVGGTEYLNIAAVPEADTSLMMLTGFGLMGFIARRRNSIKA